MLHKNRRWCVTRITPEEMSDKISAHTMCGCCAFEPHPGIRWVNDSTSPDGAQEYAVLVLTDGEWLQRESITTSWCSASTLLEYARVTNYSGAPFLGRVTEVSFDHDPECQLCA